MSKDGFNPTYRGNPRRTLVLQIISAMGVLLFAMVFILALAGGADARHRVYTVKSGDTLSRIAARQDSPGGWERLAGRNRLPDPNRIYVGQKLMIPHRARGPRWPNYSAAQARRPQQSASRSSTRGSSFMVTSTAYCLRGTMANGQQVHDGAVAMNGPSFGTQYVVLSGPKDGRVYTVKDRIGHGSDFDIWMSSCDAARQYGRRTITIARNG